MCHILAESDVTLKNASFKSVLSKQFQQFPNAYSVMISFVAAENRILMSNGSFEERNSSNRARTLTRHLWTIGSSRRMFCFENRGATGARRLRCKSWWEVATNAPGVMSALQCNWDLSRRVPDVPYTWSMKTESLMWTVSGLILTIGPVQQWECVDVVTFRMYHNAYAFLQRPRGTVLHGKYHGRLHRGELLLLTCKSELMLVGGSNEGLDCDRSKRTSNPGTRNMWERTEIEPVNSESNLVTQKYS